MHSKTRTPRDEGFLGHILLVESKSKVWASYCCFIFLDIIVVILRDIICPTSKSQGCKSQDKIVFLYCAQIQTSNADDKQKKNNDVLRTTHLRIVKLKGGSTV